MQRLFRVTGQTQMDTKVPHDWEMRNVKHIVASVVDNCMYFLAYEGSKLTQISFRYMYIYICMVLFYMNISILYQEMYSITNTYNN